MSYKSNTNTSTENKTTNRLQLAHEVGSELSEAETVELTELLFSKEGPSELQRIPVDRPNLLVDSVR